MNTFSIQQYTFRPLVNQAGLFPVLEEICELGYTGLEMCLFSGFDALGMPAKALKERLDDLGMHLIGNHFTRDQFQGSHNQAFAFIAEAGGRYAVYNIWGNYDGQEAIWEKADYLNSLSEIAKKEGITLLYHNHAPEFAMLEEKLVIDRLMDALDPEICFEHDVYFSRKQGCDVYAYLRKNASRIRAVHLKQINASGENVDLPDGILDMKLVTECASCATDFIVEQSEFSESIFSSLRRNAEFLKSL